MKYDSDGQLCLFINHYECPRCGHKWEDQWSSMCDDDCPHCGCRHISPTHTTDAMEDDMRLTIDATDDELEQGLVAARAMLAALEGIIRRDAEAESTSDLDLSIIRLVIALAKDAGITVE